jgi:hypothetical protein
VVLTRLAVLNHDEKRDPTAWNVPREEGSCKNGEKVILECNFVEFQCSDMLLDADKWSVLLLLHTGYIPKCPR